MTLDIPLLQLTIQIGTPPAQVTGEPAPQIAGSAETMVITGLNPDTTYYFAIKTSDEVPNISGLSNAASGTTLSQTPKNTISGTLKYYDGIKTIPNAAVIPEDNMGNTLNTVTMNASGYYEFTNIEQGGNYAVRAEKQDDSNEVNGLDLTKIVRHMVGLETFDSIFKIIAADVNKTGDVNGLDLTKIVRYIVGLDSELPSGDWKFYSSGANVTQENYLTEGMERTYGNLSSDMANQDFTGVKMGDTNNSWDS